MSNYRIYEQSSRYPHPVDLTKCRKRMFQHYNAYQCDRPAVVQEEGYGWCRQHAPSAKKARENARDAKWAANRKRQNYLVKQAQLEHDIVTAALNWDLHPSKCPAVLLTAIETLKMHLAGKS